MPGYGLKISQEGFDVKTCTDQQLIMSSDLNALKVKMVGTLTSAQTIAHGLAYLPIYFSFNQLDTASKWGIVGQNYYGLVPSVDATKFNAASGNTKYYVFYQPGV